jgi:hypothetical protein
VDEGSQQKEGKGAGDLQRTSAKLPAWSIEGEARPRAALHSERLRRQVEGTPRRREEAAGKLP